MISPAISPNATATSTGRRRTPSSDGFVEAPAMRIASFDREAIAETKRLSRCREPAARSGNSARVGDAFIASLGRPASQNRIKALMARGFHHAGRRRKSTRFPCRHSSAAETIAAAIGVKARV